MVQFGDGGSSFVDTTMRLVVNVPCNVVLLLWVCNDFFTLEPKLLRFIICGRSKLVVCGGTAETALLCPVGTIGVLVVLEIEANFVEALL